MRWLIAGAVAGLAMTACMFALRVVLGTPMVPELFQDQVIALIPGSLFGFAIDRLQFAAKPLLLVGLATLGVPFGSIVGWLYGRVWPARGWLGRQEFPSGVAFGSFVWLAFELAVTAWADGVAAAIASAGSLLASAEVFGLSLVVVARVLEAPREQRQSVIDRGRRVVVLGGLAGGSLVVASGAFARLLAVSETEQQNAQEALKADAARAGLGAAALPDSLTIPPGVAEEVTPNERFYIVSKNFNDPRLSADRWSLDISGLVVQARRFSYEEFLALPRANQYTTLECISNELGGKLMSNAQWTGVPLAQLLAGLGVQPDARAIIVRCADNYYESFPLGVALAPGVLLAHTMNGAPLPDKHGFPLRLILPGRYGVKNPKWITRIELAAEPIEGYWVRRGWDAQALVQTVARIDSPTYNASVTGPRVEVGGVAFAGSRGISRVEASLDGGTTWRDARTRPPLGSSTWVQWALAWDDVPAGVHNIVARAANGTGAVQTSDENGSFPSGATGYHRARIDVTG